MPINSIRFGGHVAPTSRIALVVAIGFLTLAAGCGASTNVGNDSTTTTTTTTTIPRTTTTTDMADGIVNTWAGQPVDLTKLPIGTAHVTTTTPAVGELFVCDGGNPNGGGAFAVGPWIDEAAGTWDATRKVSVTGKVSWPTAQYDEVIEGSNRKITSKGLPVRDVTGTFPIAADDSAFSYDRNPNSIAATTISLSLPVAPTAAATPSCLTKGIVGVLRNGVALFAPVDERNRDAVAYETQDECDGHPQQASIYHYHDVPSCVLVLWP